MTRWTALVLGLLLANTEAFLFNPKALRGELGAEDDVNDTVLRVMQAVNKSLAPFEDKPNTEAQAGALPGLGATIFNPPYPEPPPSSEALCLQRGYLCEKHLVQTEDGYTLAVIHVLGKIGAIRESGRPPVLVQHGMLMSSDAYLLRKDNDNLPTLLDEAGYDVWVGNYRVSAVSPKVHTNLSADSFEFYNYDWHEMGLYDLPAMVDHVLSQTDEQSLYYIGHSMGTTGMMVLLSSRPEYNDKIRLASFMAPVGYFSQFQPKAKLFQTLSFFALGIKAYLLSSQTYYVLPRSAALHRLLDTVCLFPGGEQTICEPIIFAIAGWSPEHVLADYAPTIGAYLPSGTTIRVMEHYYELTRTGKFRPLGTGIGDPNPGPEYNISAISAPIALYYSDNDYFVYPPDVERLANDLPSLYHSYKVPDATFNHFDFMLGSDAKKLVFDELISKMKLKGLEKDKNLAVSNELNTLDKGAHLLNKVVNKG